MNTSLSPGQKCPRCGAELPANAVAGLCPRCLMLGAMQPTQDGDPAGVMPAPAPEEIAAQMPKDYYAGELELYVQGLKEGRAQYSPDGMMPQGAPESVLKVLSSFSPNVQGKTIDLSKTYTTEFVIKANATH